METAIRGSAHLNIFVEEAVKAVNENGGKAARYFATDMCDGIAQGHDGINYSLAHRDAITNLIEAQANATVFDGGVFIASCDKSMPAMLMSIGRLKDMSAIVVTGGVMEAHELPKKYIVDDPACKINELLTLEQIGKFDAWEKTGSHTQGAAGLLQAACMSELRSMLIYGNCLDDADHGRGARAYASGNGPHAVYGAGAEGGILSGGKTADGSDFKRNKDIDIVTKESFENAIMVHAAISGSTNATMHLPAIAHEFGFEISSRHL